LEASYLRRSAKFFPPLHLVIMQRVMDSHYQDQCLNLNPFFFYLGSLLSFLLFSFGIPEFWEAGADCDDVTRGFAHFSPLIFFFYFTKSESEIKDWRSNSIKRNFVMTLALFGIYRNRRI
jgi:hypothetical protein